MDIICLIIKNNNAKFFSIRYYNIDRIYYQYILSINTLQRKEAKRMFEIILPNGHKIYTNLIIRRKSVDTKAIDVNVVSNK